MDIHLWQIILLSLLAFFCIYDSLSNQFIGTHPVLVGTVAGLIMGDVTMGLAVGATLQLMVLGVGTFGGASVPDFMTGAIIGTAFAVISDRGVEFGIALAVPVGLLMVQLDILARLTNTFFSKRVEAAIERMDFKGIERNVVMGILPWGLSRAIPVFLMLFFGQRLVNVIVDNMPDWLMGGLSVAGGLLPAVGIAILLRYLPVKKYLSYLIIGFVGAAYLNIPMLGVALVGLALAIMFFNQNFNNKQIAVESVGSNQEKELFDGEYED